MGENAEQYPGSCRNMYRHSKEELDSGRDVDGLGLTCGYTSTLTNTARKAYQ